MDKTCPIKSIINKTCCTSDCAFFDNDEKDCKLVMLFDYAIAELKFEQNMKEEVDLSWGALNNERE